MQEDRTPNPRPRAGRAPRRPLDGIERLIIDGTNVLHAMESAAEAPPAATLVGRLRAAIPAEVRIVLVLDGPPAPGLATRRLASGIELRHSGRRTADAVILDLVTGRYPATHGPAPAAPAATLVCSNDRELAYRARRLGTQSIGASWLIERLSGTRLSAPTAGRPTPVEPPAGSGIGIGNGMGAAQGAESEGEREPWNAGRGATRKTGNGKKAPRQAR